MGKKGMPTPFKCGVCKNKHYAIAYNRDRHEKQCRQRTNALLKWCRENPEKAHKQGYKF